MNQEDLEKRDKEKLAFKRFQMLNLSRLFALALIMVGAANISGKLLPELAPIMGYIFLVVGAADFFVMPVILKKYWAQQDLEG